MFQFYPELRGFSRWHFAFCVPAWIERCRADGFVDDSAVVQTAPWVGASEGIRVALSSMHLSSTRTGALSTRAHAVAHEVNLGRVGLTPGQVAEFGGATGLYQAEITTGLEAIDRERTVLVDLNKTTFASQRVLFHMWRQRTSMLLMSTIGNSESYQDLAPAALFSWLGHQTDSSGYEQKQAETRPMATSQPVRIHRVCNSPRTTRPTPWRSCEPGPVH